MKCESGAGGWEWVTFLKNEILYPFFTTATILLPLILIVGAFLIWAEQDSRHQAEQGRYYLTECQLVERNRDTGFWSERENILQCGVTREHVNADAYEKAIRAWQQKQAGTKNECVVNAISCFVAGIIFVDELTQ
ncbi:MULTISPECIES: hypothetical protein [Enterobacterales]|uniref:hypothetical protein n=1 Tax=Enterobacterales TaxID=91347 RepID=UPI001FCF07D3|nr:hypothetical protein [Escherichia coli]